jgi:DNA-binding transcriptional ArsR family regulator
MTIPSGLFFSLPYHPVVNSLLPMTQNVLRWLYWHRNRVTGQCNPRHATLARELHCSVSTIRNHIRILREAGIILATKGRRGNRYEIRPTEEWRTPSSTSDRQAVVSQDLSGESASILYEREEVFLNKKRSGVAAVCSVRELGGGGAPAEPKTKHPGPVVEARPVSLPPELPKPCPDIPAIPRVSPNVPDIPRTSHEEAVRVVTELLPQHPQPGHPEGAVKQITKLLTSGATAEQIRVSHAQWRKMWAVYREGRFIPQLWRWIHDNDWRFPPDEKQIQSNTDPNRGREAADRLRMEQLAAAREAARPAEEAIARKQARRQEIEHLEDMANGRIIWPEPTPEMVERARRRLAAIRAEEAA